MAQEEALPRAAERLEGDEAVRVGRVSYALAYIDNQAPLLTYLGFALWIAWNSLAFSGTAWFYDPTNSLLIEELVSQHLVACIVASLVLALTAKWSMHLTAKNWFTLLGAAVACVGTALIIVARGDTPLNHCIFTAGCACTGLGTTVLFVRGVPLLGALPPRKAMLTLIYCTLAAYAVFFMVNSCPRPINGVLFAALPAVSALFYCLRSIDVNGEEQVLHRNRPLALSFPVLMACICFCGFGFDLVRSYLLVDLSPQDSNIAQVYAGIMIVGVFVVMGAIGLLTKPGALNGAKMLYSTTLSVLVVLLAVFVLVMPQNMLVASCAKAIQTVFNTTVWAMFAYIVFQSKSNVLHVFCFGNSALCVGTLLASRLGMLYFDAGISDSTIRLILSVLCIAVLLIVLFVFPEKRLDKLMLPIESERLTSSENAGTADKPGANESADDESEKDSGDGSQDGRGERRDAWRQRIELIAQKYKLSPRETVVFTWLAKGRTQQQIADIECVSIHTVRSQARSIHIKMEVHSKTELDKLIEEEMRTLDEASACA